VIWLPADLSFAIKDAVLDSQSIVYRLLTSEKL